MENDNNIQIVDMEGISFLAHNGVDQKILSKVISGNDLLRLLCNEWLPYIECHKCGRWKTCQYAALPHPANPHRSLEKQCGVAEQALSVFLNAGLPHLTEVSKEIKMEFLDAAFYLTQYVFQSEQTVGNFLDSDIVSYYGEYSPLIVSNLKYLRRYMDGLCSSLRHISEFRSTQSVLLVEGESELRFLKRMVTSSMAGFRYHEYDTYSGTGNRINKRIQMLLNHYHAKGYDVYLQIDADGKNFKQVSDSAAESLGLKPERIFAFTRDFETSIPRNIAIKALSILLNQEPSKINGAWTTENTSAGIKQVLAELAPKTSLNDIKVELAHTLGDLLASDYTWYENEAFMNSELGRFLSFVQNI
jgi:hypothetical protein